MVLDEDIKIGDVVVAKAGCQAMGSVTNAKKAGMTGKAGELNMRLEHLTTESSSAVAKARKDKARKAPR